jgi:hypothetical protein
MGASEWGKPPNALRAKGVEKKEEVKLQFIKIVAYKSTGFALYFHREGFTRKLILNKLQHVL